MTNAVLTSDDIDELENAAHAADDPMAVATQLQEAAEQGRIADPADTGYAYLLAAELHDQQDSLESALALAQRGIAAYQAVDERYAGWPRAYHAELLSRLGRQDEALAELSDLRPLLTTDELAASYVGEALEEVGRGDLAQTWLTEALDEVTEQYGDDLPDELAGVVYELSTVRHRIRTDLELPHDRYDTLADMFRAADDELDDDELDDEDEVDEEPVLLWWPQADHAAVASRWPAVAEGESWDEVRELRQALIVGWGERGLPALQQVTGTADGFAAFLAEHGRDADDEAVEAYLADLVARGEAQRLPPGRNEPCWCGSGQKYKKCCLLLLTRRT